MPLPEAREPAGKARGWSPLDWPAAPHPDDEPAFWAHRRDEGARTWSMLLLFSFLLTILSWPTDYLFFRDVPGAIRVFALTRGFAAVATFGMFLLVTKVPAVRRRPYLAMGTAALSVFVFSAWQLARLGGPNSIWIHFTHLGVLSPMAISLRRRDRVLLTIAIAVVTLGAFFVSRPEHLHDPLAGALVNWFGFLVLLGIATGLFADALRRNEFFQRRSAVRLAGELRMLKDSLEERVEERTREVRRLATHLESARESERARIARELHDELGQELTALRYAFELTRNRWGNDPTSIGRNLADIDALLKRTRLTARAIVTELRPRVLDDLGFVAASEWLVEKARERCSAEITLTRPRSEPALAPEVATAAFRVLQEALTNATRHANATRIDVTIEQKDGLSVIIADDGAGFDPQRARSADGGFGLIGMRERAASLGGSFEMKSSPGAGATITLRLPMAPENTLQEAVP